MSVYRVKSMTGFGRAQRDTSRGQFVVEIRSVNNRFVDVGVALPRELNLLETPLRALVKQRIPRGKVDLRVRFTPNETQLPQVKLNAVMAAQYIEQLRKLQELGASGDVPMQLIASLPGVLDNSAADVDEQLMWRYLQSVVDQAIESLDRERAREGLAIGQQLQELGAELRAEIEEMAGGQDGVVEKFRQRLRQRITELLGEAKDQVDPGRLEQEVALFADRADINEELVRLRAHLDRYDQLLKNEDGNSVGKNVDFLIQEFSREINTICSKTRDSDLTGLALNMKSVVERMREQIQNVE